MSFSEWIFVHVHIHVGGQTWYNFYTTYIGVDLAHHEILCPKVGKGGIKSTNSNSHYILFNYR